MRKLHLYYGNTVPSNEMLEPVHSDEYLDEVAHASDPDYDHFTEHLCLSPVEPVCDMA